MDRETGLYYLVTRYYDPVTCRFINADGYFQTGQGLLDKNMSAYCMNNPVMHIDPTGRCYKIVDLPGSVRGAKWFLTRSIPGVPNLCGNCNTYRPGSETWVKQRPPVSPPPASSSRQFNTPNAAAIDFVLRYGGTSISEKREYGAIIVPVEINGEIMYTYPEPNVGPIRTGATGSCMIDWDVNTVAYVHTHGQYVVSDNNIFSFTDKGLAIEEGVLGYLGTPSGIVRKYDPWSGSDTVIYSNAPRDPMHP